MSLKIFFGPYEKRGVIRHKKQRLIGVVEGLQSLGYIVELIPTKRLNVVVVQYLGIEVYRCDIRHFLFNIDYEDDIVAQKLVSCVEEAKTRFENEENVAKFAVNKKIVTGDTREYLSEDIDLLFEIPMSFKETKEMKTKGNFSTNPN